MSCGVLTQYLSKVRPQLRHLIGILEPELRIVFPQHNGREVTLGTVSETESRSRWTDPSGALRPTHDILSPGRRDLSNLLTCPPSLNATNLIAVPLMLTMMFEWAPLVCLGVDNTVPD